MVAPRRCRPPSAWPPAPLAAPGQMLRALLVLAHAALALSGVCENGPSRVWFEYWKGDDDSTRAKTTPLALVFENVMMRGNVVLMCDVPRTFAREILCTYNRGCQRTPELAFPGLRIANEKEGWIEGDDSFIYGEEKGCLAHYSSSHVLKECSLDPVMFGTSSQCQTLSIATPLSLLTAPKVPPFAGVMRLNGTTVRHVIRGSNVGLWWQEDFFHFYRLLTPSFTLKDGLQSAVAAVAVAAAAASDGANSTLAAGGRPGSNSNSTSDANARVVNATGTTEAARSQPPTKGGNGIYSLKESALNAFRAKGKTSNSGKDRADQASSLPSHILMDSIIDYRNWSETAAALRYEAFFSESRGASEGIPNKRDVDGVGISKHGGDKASLDAGMHSFIKQNKEWARSLVYCSVLRPFQLAQQASAAAAAATASGGNNSSVAGRLGGNGTTSRESGAATRSLEAGRSAFHDSWVKMQDPKTVYSTSRLVIQPFDRCVTHGKVEPTTAFDERRRRFSNLRSDVHDCVAINKSTIGSVVLLYGRSDLKNRRWGNVFDVASKIQNTPGVRLPVKVVERMPHTFREQVQLFASAAMLITVHGAALVNVPFMPFSSTLVELVRFSKGETSLIRTFGLDAAISSHVVIDIRPADAGVATASAKQASNDVLLSFNLLRQKLCDKNDVRKQINGKAPQKRYTDSALAFADMNLFCANVTSHTAATSLKNIASGFISAVGGRR